MNNRDCDIVVAKTCGTCTVKAPMEVEWEVYLQSAATLDLAAGGPACMIWLFSCGASLCPTSSDVRQYCSFTASGVGPRLQHLWFLFFLP